MLFQSKSGSTLGLDINDVSDVLGTISLNSVEYVVCWESVEFSQVGNG